MLSHNKEILHCIFHVPTGHLKPNALSWVVVLFLVADRLGPLNLLLSATTALALCKLSVSSIEAVHNLGLLSNHRPLGTHQRPSMTDHSQANAFSCMEANVKEISGMDMQGSKQC